MISDHAIPSRAITMRPSKLFLFELLSARRIRPMVALMIDQRSMLGSLESAKVMP